MSASSSCGSRKNEDENNAGGEGGGDDGKTSPSRCIPCESMDPSSSILSLTQIEEVLRTKLPLWTLSERRISPPAATGEEEEKKKSYYHQLSRQFTTKNFQSALNTMNDIGIISERENHHPDLHLTNYREFEIVLYTHKVGGITENDVMLATMFDREVKVTYSPKWLREHPEAYASSSSSSNDTAGDGARATGM